MIYRFALVKLRNFICILAVSLILAGYSAYSLAGRERTLPSTDAASSTVAGIPLLRLGQAETLWQEPSTLFVDVRSWQDYEFGHIPGAVHLPEEEFETRFPKLESRLRQAQTIVVYCGSRNCGLSLWAAIRLHNAGLTQAAIFPGGWNEWSFAGLPTAGGR